MSTRTALHFALTGNPVGPAEQRVVEPNVRQRGLDACYWDAMNGLLTTRSRSDTPLVLRAYRGERLVGLAHIMECRRTNRCFFPGMIGRTLDVVPTPIYYWTRGDAAVDLLGSPGFVSEGEDSHEFYCGAVRFLNRRYLLGAVMDERGSESADQCYETPFMDWGRYTVKPGGVEMLLDSHKHLRRKENRFRNKGGRLQIVTGRLSAADRDAVLHCVHQSAQLGLARTPFQENYGNMVQWATESSSSSIVHILARIDDVVVGYHTFLQTGDRMQCLSGGFDRTRHSTYHAYENILLAAMRHAEDANVHQVAFGPVGNPSKAGMMPEFAHFVLRFYSRFSALRHAIGVVVPRSGIRPEVFAACSGLS